MPTPDRMTAVDSQPDITDQLTECHGGSVTACVFGPRLQWAVSGGWDGHLLEWDPVHRRSIGRWVGSSRPITALAASYDGTMILSGDMDGRVSLWNSLTKQAQKLDSVHTRNVGGLAISGNGKAYASAGWDSAVHVWYRPDESQPPVKHILRGHRDLVTGCKFWPDGRWLLTWSYDSTVVLWELSRGVAYRTWYLEEGQRIVAADVAPDARFLVVAALSGAVFVWNLHDSHHPPVRWQASQPVRAVFVSPDARELIVVGERGRIDYLHLPELYPTSPPIEMDFEVGCAAMAPAGELLALGAEDGSLLFHPLSHLARSEMIVTTLERVEEQEETGLWGKLSKRTKLVRMRRANCPKCGRLLEFAGDSSLPPGPCPGCQRAILFTPFTLAG